MDVSITGQRVSRLLDRLAVERGRPEAITVAMGQSSGVRPWLCGLGGPEWSCATSSQASRSRMQESFNGKFRDVCLNVQWFVDLADARHSIEA